HYLKFVAGKILDMFHELPEYKQLFNYNFISDHGKMLKSLEKIELSELTNYLSTETILLKHKLPKLESDSETQDATSKSIQQFDTIVSKVGRHHKKLLSLVPQIILNSYRQLKDYLAHISESDETLKEKVKHLSQNLKVINSLIILKANLIKEQDK